MGKICDMDCFNCKFPDCINDTTYPESARYCNWSEERKIKQRERSRINYKKAIENGLCGVCKQRPQYRGVRCYECWLRQKRYNDSKALHKREYRAENNLCYYCDNPVVPGKKTCEKHLAMFQEIAAHRRTFINKENHKWRKDNNAMYFSKQHNAENSNSKGGLIT